MTSQLGDDTVLAETEHRLTSMGQLHEELPLDDQRESGGWIVEVETKSQWDKRVMYRPTGWACWMVVGLVPPFSRKTRRR